MVICVYWFCCQCRDDDAAPFATPKESPNTKTKKSCRSYHCALLLLQLLRLCEGNFLEIGFATGRQKFLFNYQVLCVHTSRRHGHSNKNNNKNNAEKNSWLSSSTKSWTLIHTYKYMYIRVRVCACVCVSTLCYWSACFLYIVRSSCCYCCHLPHYWNYIHTYTCSKVAVCVCVVSALFSLCGFILLVLAYRTIIP